MSTEFLEQTDQDQPPEGLSPALTALWWLAKGDYAMGPEWEHAHAFGQANEGHPTHDIVHAVAHLIEGDIPNADYWYRRAGDTAESRDHRAEVARIAAKLA